MGNFDARAYAKKRYLEKQNRTNMNEGRASTSSAPSGNGFDARAYAKKQYAEKNHGSEFGLDTLSADLKATAQTVDSVYNGWQTKETMENTRATIQSMYDRLGKYQEFQKKYGGTDLSQLHTAYKAVLDDWNGIASHYGKFKDADSYNKALEKTKKEAEAYEGMKNADLNTVQAEISELEEIYKTAQQHDSKVKGLTRRGANWDSRVRSKGAGNIADKIQSAENELNEFLKGYGYESTEALKNALDEKKLYFDNAKKLQNEMALAEKESAMASSGEATEGLKKWDEFVAGRDKERTEGYKEPAWVKGMRYHDDPMAQVMDLKRGDTSYQEPQDDWTQEERNIFGAYFLENPESAYDYAARLNNQKALAEKEKGKQKYSDKATSGVWSGIGHTAAAVITSPLHMADYLDDLTDLAAGRRTIVEEGMVTPLDYSQAVQGGISEKLNEYGTLSEDIPVIGGKGWGDVYNLGTSIAQSAASATTLGEWGTLVSYFGQGAASAVDDALARGASSEEALVYGTIVGAAEGVSEKIGIDNLLKIGKSSTLKEFFVNVMRQAGAEGLEEGFSSVAEKIADNFVMKDKSNFNAMVSRLVAQGMSYEEAKNKAWIESVEEIAFDTLSGAISGAAHAGPRTGFKTAKAHINNVRAGRSIRANDRIGDVFDIASNPEVASAYEAYTEYANKGINADSISDAQLGKLAYAVAEDAYGVINSDTATAEQKAQAERTLSDMDVYTQKNSWTGKKSAEKYDDAMVHGLIDAGLESDTNSESYKLATEYKAKIESGKKLTTAEITAIVEANERTYKAEDAKAVTDRLTELGETADVSKVARIIERKMNGETITADEYQTVKDSKYGNQVLLENTDTDIVSQAEVMDADDGELFMRLYDGKTDAEAYANSFNLVAEYAKMPSISAEYVLEHRGVLTPAQTRDTYNHFAKKASKEAKIKFNKEAQQEYKAAVAKMEENLKVTRKGFVDTSVIDFDNKSAEGKVNWKDLKPEQQQAVTFVSGLFKAMGANVVFVNKTKKFNGMYHQEGDTVFVDVYAGMDIIKMMGKDSIIPTTAHELTHMMEVHSPEEFKELADMVLDFLSETKHLTRQELIAEEIARLDEKHSDDAPHSEKDAVSEIVARACEDMLSVSKEGRRLFESLSEEQQKSFVDKVKEIFKKLTEWLDKLLNSYESASDEAKAIRGVKSVFDEVSAHWDKMLADIAGGNTAAVTTSGKARFELRKDAVSEVEKAIQNEIAKGNLVRIKNKSTKASESTSLIDGDYSKSASTDIIRNSDRNVKDNFSDRDSTEAKFQMRENMEETRDLIAVHNVSPEKLLKTLKLGGLPMPSIAITRAREGYNNFGDISLVFSKDTIDPGLVRSNKVYSGDAWTPTYPRVEYKVNTNAQEKIKKRIDELVPRKIQSDLGGIHLDASNMEDTLNRNGGDMVPYYRYNSAMKYAFLKDNNADIELPTEDEPLYRYGEVSNGAVISFANKMVEGLKTVNSLLEQHSSKLMADEDLIKGIAAVLNEDVMSTADANSEAYQKLVENPLFKPEDIDLSTVLGMLEAARKYFNTNGRTESRINYREAKTLIDEKTNMIEYESWLKDLFSDVIGKEGLRNDKDLFTPSGNRRSFDALHYEHTLENVVKAMKAKGAKGIGGFGGGNIFGASTREYGSIADIKADAENRIELLPESEYDEIKKGFSDRLFELASSLPKNKDSFSAIDDAANMLIEAVVKFKTKSAMANYLRSESQGWANYNDYVVDDLIQLVSEIRQMPVAYFEAKPQRAVGLNEIKAVIMPAQESYEDDLTDVKSELEKLGVPILEYEYGDNNARIKALNSLESVRFSDRDYSYDAFIAKPDMQLIVLDSNVPDNRADIISEAKKNASKVGMLNTDDETVSVFVDDIGRNIVIGSDGLRHGMARGKNIQSRPIGIVTVKAGEIIKNSIRINELTPSKESATGSYVLIGTAIDKNNNLYIVRSVVNEYDNKLTSMDVLYAINTKKEPAMLNASRYAKNSLSVTDSTISIADLLDYVNKYFPDILPESVLRHYGHDARPEPSKDDRLGESALFSDRETTTVYDRMGEMERLQKRYEILEADYKKLKERYKLEGKVTKGEFLDDKQLQAVTRYIKKTANSGIEVNELYKMLREVYSDNRLHPEWRAAEVYARCVDVAEAVIAEAEPVTIKDDYAKMILKEIKGTRIRLSESQKAEAQYIFGKNWNRHFFGKVIISDSGIPIDSQWKEWAEMYPHLFRTDISDRDMIGELYDIISSVKEAYEYVAEYDESEQVQWIATEIWRQQWRVDSVHTTADKYNAQIKVLKFEHRKAMQEMRATFNESQKDALNEQRIKYKKLIADLRTQRDEGITRAKQHGKEKLSQYKENAERKTRIQRITANALTLNKWLTNNNKDFRIHEAMKGPVIKLLNAIDFSSGRLISGGNPTQRDISLAEAFADVRTMLANATSMVPGLEELYGHDLTESIELLAEGAFAMIGDNSYTINTMSNEDLYHLDKLVRHIKKTITELNNFHTIHHNQGAINLGEEFIEYGEKLKTLDKQHGKYGKFLLFRNRTPYYFFKELGSAGQKMFEAFQDGWDKLAFNAKKVIDFTEETYTSEEVQKWSEEKKTFTLLQPDGSQRTIEMSIAQIMSLHCVAKQDDAQYHLFGGGMTLKRIDKKGHVITDYKNISLTMSDVQMITSALDRRQIEVADKLQKFMNTVCSDWGNEISMARFGIKMFGIDNYFPIKVSSATVPTDTKKDIDNASLFRLLNMSFTKDRKHNAPQSIEIGDIFDIFAQHSAEMAKYNALALPVLDFSKWYSMHGVDANGKEYGVAQTLQSVFGDEADGYLKRFIRDLNGSQNVSRDVLGNTFLKNAKIASVAANLRVILLQPTAYFKACAVMDNKYLMKASSYVKVNPVGMIGKLKKAAKRAEEYCGIIQWKALGYYDTDISKGLTAKIKHADSKVEKLIEKSMKGAEIADKATFATLWIACEFEIRDTRSDLRPGSREFYEAIGKRLRDIVYATQVVDSTMTRSDMMRSSDGRDKMLTTFGSEPIIAYNMLLDLATTYNRDKQAYGADVARKKNATKIRKVVTAYVITNAVAAIVESGFDYLRDDEDEMDAAEFMKMWLSNFALDMSIGNKLPGIKEIYSLAQGYSSSRMDTQGIGYVFDVINDVKKLLDGKGKPMKLTKDVLKAFSSLSGLPAYNIFRDAMAFLDKLNILGDD